MSYVELEPAPRRKVKCPATQLSLRHLRAEGWTCQVVEHWNANTRRKNDLFGVIDILALRDEVTLGVQTTSAGNVASRIRKIEDSPMTPIMREAGWWIHVHGWKQPGGPNTRWVLHRNEDVS